MSLSSHVHTMKLTFKHKRITRKHNNINQYNGILFSTKLKYANNTIKYQDLQLWTVLIVHMFQKDSVVPKNIESVKLFWWSWISVTGSELS
jgi:hypothetical protein